MVLLAALLIFAAPVWAQAGKAELRGTIQDPSALPVAHAKIEAWSQATMARFAARSNEGGEYHLLGLPAGEYVLSVEQPGFRSYRQSGIRLRIADQTELNVKLELGPQSQTIDVQAAAPLLQTAS